MTRPTTVTTSAEGATRWLREVLGLPEGDTPFPWQKELLRRFVNGTIERSLDIPTGLGKTAVMAIWLVARAHGAALPRRLVYVVDRRAVVDQATEVAEGLRDFVHRDSELKHALGLGSRLLPISTLRGQHVDNKEWLEDPACLAIIVGTVDMIGSRLLFEGYGTSRKMRPYQAGLLGADTLVVLDEAHLVPPFEKLLESVAYGHSTFGPRGDILRKLVPAFKLLALSATGRAIAGKKYGLQAADLEHPIVRKRLDAPKRLTVLPPPDNQIRLSDALAEQAWTVATNGTVAVRCIVFCDRRKVAEETLAVIKELSKGDKKSGIPKVEVDTELLVGGRRVFEREEAAKWLRNRGFIAGAQMERARPAFVVATSAGEVGVDLDADHMVSDLVAWERMVQRLGRVNRRGEGEAEVIVVDEQLSKEVQKAQEKTPEERNAKERLAVADAERKNAVRQLFKLLPENEGARDASPGALRALKLSGEADAELQAILDTATTPDPLRPALSRPLVDAWSMTSLKEHTGRPEIDPWLRGWVADDPPQTVVVWRTHLPIRTEGSAAKKKEIEAFFEAAPPHVSETLETETFRVVEWLSDRANDLIAPSKDETSTTDDAGNDESTSLCKNDVIGFALTHANDLRAILRLDDLATGDKDKVAIKKSKADLERKLAGATLVVDARIGGLLREGLLDPSAKYLPRTADHGDDWMWETTGPVVRFRVLSVDANWFPGVDRAQWRERLRFATELSDDGEPARWLIVQKW
jgi:CRISPR-associated endonuclease/helicase Cas3